MASQILNSLNFTRNTLEAGTSCCNSTFSVTRLPGCRTDGGDCGNIGSKRHLIPLLPAGHRSPFSLSSTRSDTSRVVGAKSHQRRPLPLLVVVRPDRPHPVRDKPADDRPHRVVHRTHAHGGVPPVPAGKTLRRGAIRSVSFHRR